MSHDLSEAEVKAKCFIPTPLGRAAQLLLQLLPSFPGFTQSSSSQIHVLSALEFSVTLLNIGEVTFQLVRTYKAVLHEGQKTVASLTLENL